MTTNTQQSALDAFFLDWIERMERLRIERARERVELTREIWLECWEPSGAAN